MFSLDADKKMKNSHLNIRISHNFIFISLEMFKIIITKWEIHEIDFLWYQQKLKVCLFSFFSSKKKELLWKMKVINPYKFKKFVRTFLCSCINGICLGFVIWQTIKCMIKFIEKPKGTEVSMKKSANLSFPAITVCGLFGKDVNGDDMGLNETYLQNVCGLRYYSVVLIFSPFKNCKNWF